MWKRIVDFIFEFVNTMAFLVMAVAIFGMADVQIVAVTADSSDVTVTFRGQDRSIGNNSYGLIATNVPLWDLDAIQVQIEGNPEWVATQVTYPKILRVFGVHGCLDLQGVAEDAVEQEITDVICRITYTGR